MPTVNLVLGQDGKPEGFTDRDKKAYAKWRKKIFELGSSIVTFSWKEPRSGPFHRRHFAMLNALFEAQEQFHDERQFRKWLEIGAGHCDFVPGPKGQMVAMAKSIDYDALDQAEFEPIHEAVFGFVRGEHCKRFLWPHLTPDQAWQMLESVLGEFY